MLAALAVAVAVSLHVFIRTLVRVVPQLPTHAVPREQHMHIQPLRGDSPVCSLGEGFIFAIRRLGQEAGGL